MQVKALDFKNAIHIGRSTGGNDGRLIMNTFLAKNHYSVTITKDVHEICEDFFKTYGIAQYLYARVFDDGSAYPLISNAEYHLYHINKGFSVTPPVSKEMLKPKFYYLVTPNQLGKFDHPYSELRNMFNCDHPFYMFERHNGFFDLYTFCSTLNNHNIINFYFNNIDILEQFNFYFKEKAAKIIQKSNENRIILPPHMRPNFGGLNNATLNSYDQSRRDTLHKFSVKRYAIDVKGKKVMLAKQEVECLKHMIKGYTAKEIAKQMTLSPRTVETYLNNLKIKLGIREKSKLINFALNLNLF